MGRDNSPTAFCTTCAAQCADHYVCCPRCGSNEILIVGLVVERAGTIQIETRLRSLEEADGD